MKRITLLLLLGLFLFAAVVPGCKKEEITNIEYSVIWKGSLETAPANPEAGWAYYNTKLGQSFIYDGASWQVMSENGKDGKDGKDGVDGKDGQNGLGLVWKGELEAAPSDAQTNWAYYNSTEKKSFIYDGTTWLVLAKDGAQGEKGADGQNGKDGTNGTNGTDGGTSAGFVWKGELEANPTEPQTNWAYYNKTDKKAYVYDGEKWSILAQDGKDGKNGENGQNGNNGQPSTSIVWQESTTEPTNPQIGWAYYNSTDKKSYIYTAAGWKMIAQDGQNGENGADGVGIVWQESTTEPSNPQIGWAYYNSADKKSYIYTATGWKMIAQDGEDAQVFIVKFDSDGGTPVVSQPVVKDGKVDKPANPTKEGYFLKGWKNGDAEFDFTTEITDNLTLKAEWQKIEFSVSATNKVAFSSGNLQKVGSQYQFAASQTEYVGAESGDKIDLFQWADNFDTYISGWRVLTDAEWKYLIDNHTKQWKTVNNVNGLVILPDECTASISDDWAILEAAGAVFLPCGTNSYGEYWSSSPDGSDNAYYLDFLSDGYVGVYDFYRDSRLAVRLVRSL